MKTPLILYKILSKIALRKKRRQYYRTLYRSHLYKRQNDISIPKNILDHVTLLIHGQGNKVNIGQINIPRKGNLSIEIYGCNNRISISDGVRIHQLRLTIGEGYQNAPTAHNSAIYIGKNCVINDTEIFTSHSNATIEIGEDCMFSTGIVIRHTDSHPIYELGSNQHINRVDTLKIGNHVWVGWHVCIWKNVTIADDCILGAHAVVAKSFTEPHCAIDGNPARIIRRNITWESAHTKEFIENTLN